MYRLLYVAAPIVTISQIPVFKRKFLDPKNIFGKSTKKIWLTFHDDRAGEPPVEFKERIREELNQTEVKLDENNQPNHSFIHGKRKNTK